jgi:phage shock protein A
MTELWVSDFAWGYIAAGRPADDTARRAAVARQHRAEAALQIANDDRRRLCDEYNQLAAYANALIAENTALRQDGANVRQENSGLRQESAGLRQHAADLKAWGESLRDQLAEARRIAEYNALCEDVRKDLTRMLCG